MSRKQWACLIAGVGVAAWAVTYHLVLGNPTSPILTSLYLFDAGLVTFYLLAVGFGPKFYKRPPALGRVVVIVPAYNEETPLLHAAIDSLLNQTIEPDEIHVMDDGSKIPVEMFHHPKVFWHYQSNTGKRGAQAGVLAMLNPNDWDFVLTVDSDSVPEPDALEHLLRAMDKPEVMAATGLILTRNWSDNWLTRIADLNIGVSCLMIRTSRSVIGSVETTSGALALYRAEVLFDNLQDYLSSGTNGDDRRLTMYASLRGDVVVVNEAMVNSAMPDKLGDTYRQRLRWGKSAWQAMPFTAINLPFKKQLFPALAFWQWLILPAMVAWLVASLIVRHNAGVMVLAFLAYIVIRYTETAMYLMDRPHMSWWTRIWHWVLLTPAEMAVKAVIIYPAKYMAVLKLRDRGWVTRGNAHGVQKRPVWGMRLGFASLVLGAGSLAFGIWHFSGEPARQIQQPQSIAGAEKYLPSFFPHLPPKVIPTPTQTPKPPTITHVPVIAPTPTHATARPSPTPTPKKTTAKPTKSPTPKPSKTTKSASPSPSPSASTSASPSPSPSPSDSSSAPPDDGIPNLPIQTPTPQA